LLKKARKTSPEQHLLNANQQIRTLLNDTSLPAAVRQELFQELTEFEATAEKLQQGENHIAAIGRVEAGKSSLLNALLGREACSTSPLNGETRFVQRHDWENEHLSQRPREPDIKTLRAHLWNILGTEGKTLAALHTALFTCELYGRIAGKIVPARKTVAARIIRNYCLAKGLVVAVNPIPVADLLAVAGTDVTMVIHLENVYSFQLSRREASKLLLTISAQMLLLMAAYWGVNVFSATVKTMRAGMSATLTAGAQGPLAWYATYVTGHAEETWFAKGKSWGSEGPKETIHEILGRLDGDSILRNARDELVMKLKTITPNG